MYDLQETDIFSSRNTVSLLVFHYSLDGSKGSLKMRHMHQIVCHEVHISTELCTHFATHFANIRFRLYNAFEPADYFNIITNYY